MIENLLAKFQKLDLSILPTPIYKLEKLSQFLSANIYCMRDDLTGFALGGNKTRKLDYLIADALSKNVDTLIAVGANQSNFCRITSAYGKANNLDVQLVLAGKESKNPTGNLLLDHLFGAMIHHVDTEDADRITEEAKNLENKLLENGKKVYYLPMGGSVPIGTLGYIEAFNEIMTFSENNGISFSHIIHASGSGGTQAGLALGQGLCSWEGKIIGMSVARNSTELYNTVNEICLNTIKEFDLNLNILNIYTEDKYVGEKYGARTKDAEEAIRLFAELEGIILDQVYTGKAAAGLIDYARTKHFAPTENILFIHTGGHIQLFE